MSGLIGIQSPKPNNPASNEGATDGFVQDIGQQDFEVAVIEASMTRPVLVDFWADWCGPCKTLGPILEKVVNAAGGAVTLAKINTEENQELAAQLRIQSLPTVYAFFEGRPIDGFQGALPESEVKAFIEKLIETTGATPLDDNQDLDSAIVKAGELIDGGSLDQADALITDLMAVAGDNQTIIILMAKLLLAQGKQEELSELLESFEPDLLDKPEIKAIKASVTFAQDAKTLPDAQALRLALSANPESSEAKFDLARSLLATGQRAEAVDLLLDIFKKDRDWSEGATRLKILEVFDAFGPTDPFTISTRRRFSALFYS